MSTLGYILLFTFIGSIGALIGGILLLSREKFALKISHFLASFAAGVLLGTAFFDLLPEALHEAASNAAIGEEGIDVFFWTLFGIIIFFLTERFIHWFHHHEDFHDHKMESKSTLPLIIFGDAMHNFIDGVVIAATFMASVPLGVVTALAVFAHEIPQEIGDFGLMLHKGLRKKKIILVNVLSAAVSFIGAIATYLLGGIVEGYVPVFLAITAGFFIYIASSDLIPEIHHEKRRGFAIIESFLLVVGIAVIWVTVSLIEHG
ncbi:MAG: ZIP family metal transporter [Candidatus Levybacteria bacterium]|nr:ZIP family metal transporter [Candidatus Levybacteria bacterium]